ncbi:MAG: 4-(cytidine 5'-diphospho)-2-C-methyl-D-erythritol kinase [Nitrospirae bacterium]|nr:4-(cytidine 5'-diphospho)-2-C-methyl-D-erythritol kinase [Nitrospirota bacterium]
MTKRCSGSISTPGSSITVLAPAKINLILRILDRRPDGFHNLWSLMQTVGLEDEVVIRLSQDHSTIRLQCDSLSLSTDHTNLVHRAAAAVLHHSERKVGLDIMLTKRIPVGAGLGGGSSDAAATIIGLNRLLNLGWSAMDMAQVAQVLGSDIPFFFFAPSATVAGRGEHVSSIQIAGNRWVVLVNPGFPVETKWAYQQLSASRAEVQPLSHSHAALGRERHLSWKQILEVAENDFEVPVFKAHPGLQEIKRALLDQGAEAALLSGSGATVFGVFRNEVEAQQARARVQVQSQLKVFAVSTGSVPLVCQ